MNCDVRQKSKGAFLRISQRYKCYRECNFGENNFANLTISRDSNFLAPWAIEVFKVMIASIKAAAGF